MVFIKGPEEQDSNARKFDRRHSVYYLRIYDTNSGELMGNLVDISEGGLMMVSDKPLKIGSTYHLTMHLPEQIKDQSTIEFSAKAKWCKNEANPKFFDTGLELISKDGDFQMMLENLIDAYMFNKYTGK